MKKMIPSVKRLLLVLFPIVLLTSGCNDKQPAVGLEDEIFVIADSTDYYEIEPALYETFSKVIYTPQAETLFELKRLPFEKLSTVKGMKNIIIAAPLNGEGFAAEYVNSLLDSAVYDLVSDGKEFVFNKHDLWAKNQLVMVLTAPDIEDLQKKILLNKETLLHYFRKASDERLLKGVYKSSFEQKDIEAQLLKDYGWMVYVQKDMKLAKDAPEDNFVWLRRGMNTDMERWVFVHWIDDASPEWLDKDSISAIRDRMTSKYYRSTNDSSNVIIAQDQLTTYKEVNFLGRYALMANGFWRFSDKSGGGPYLSYTFFDEETKRLYMLDGSVFAPKYYKKKLIQQLDITLQSFLMKRELSKEKIENMMDELED